MFAVSPPRTDGIGEQFVRPICAEFLALPAPCMPVRMTTPARTTTDCSNTLDLLQALCGTKGCEAPALDVDQAHVWRLPLDAAVTTAVDLQRLLDGAERERADRLRGDRLRQRFVAGRALVRILLGWYLGRDPEGLRLAVSALGKPELEAQALGPTLQFNVAHSGDELLVALSPHHAVGVDIEQTRVVVDHEAIARANFAADEVRSLQRLPKPRQAEAFIATWTRKEAVVKALGRGLLEPLDAFVVEVDPDAPARLLAFRGDCSAAAGWTMWSARLPSGAHACVAVTAAGVTVRPFGVWEIPAAAEPPIRGLATPHAPN